MLRPIRRHRKNCAQYGKSGTDCPSQKKNKCPLVVHLYVNRKRREKSLGTNDLEVAWKIIRQMVLAESGGEARLSDAKLPANVAETNPEPSHLEEPKTVAQAIADYLSSEKQRGIGDSTLRSFRKFLCGNPQRKKDAGYSQTLLEFANAEGICYLKDFTPVLADKARQQWKLRGRALEVQHERYQQFFKQMFEMGVIPSNPAEKLKRPNIQRDPMVAFDREQRERILDAVKNNKRLLAANLVLKYTGLAPVDLVHLGPNKLKTFEDNKGVFYIVTRRKKTGKRVQVKIPKFLAEMLQELPVHLTGLWWWNREDQTARGERMQQHERRQAQAKPGEALPQINLEPKHETATGNLRRSMRKYFRLGQVWLKDEDGDVVFEKDGRPKLGHLYQWRHTFVHMHLMKGTPIERIAEMIGDTVETVMKNYAHFIRERQAALDESQESVYDYADADLAHRCERKSDEGDFEHLLPSGLL